ncbi:MAG TPA: hypothetical protein PK509_00320 [Catalimonadaceae bacterium]|nr:hypothetical protein [Catalimonadaceae bacterium]HPI09436.1 hypothetical protein [Catalimonadaceae bacterium]
MKKSQEKTSRSLPAMFRLAGSLLVCLCFFSCSKVTLEVEHLPENTPAGSPLFVSGNFNLWDPGDGNFLFRKADNGKYYLEFPTGWGEINYKFTRGDWTTVEGDGCGHSIGDRRATVGRNWFDFFKDDTIRHRIFSWEDQGPTDCDKVTFRIKRLPKETPSKDVVYMVGSFNDWLAGDRKYGFVRAQESGFYYLDLPKSDHEIEFKLNRGTWEKEEADINGDRIPNRKFSYGTEDTVDLDVGGWIDLNPGIEARQVTMYVSTPVGTPPGDPLYIVGNFNHWVPGDPKFALRKVAPNLFTITLRKPEGEMEYKFTRGQWGMEEVDVFGNHISNRKLRTSADTVRISIPEWLDIPVDQTFSLSRDEINYIMHNPEVIAFPVNKGKGEKLVKFTIIPDMKQPTYIYVRIGLPSSPNNRNYGFVELAKPGQKFKIACPDGAIFYACNGPYWNDNSPKEVKIFTVSADMEGAEFHTDLTYSSTQKSADKKP